MNLIDEQCIPFYTKQINLKKINHFSINLYHFFIILVGSVTAEMLTRCGIGKLILFDYDTVELGRNKDFDFLFKIK